MESILNPQFDKYTREAANIRSLVGALNVDAEWAESGGRVCEIPRTHYDSVFSEPHAEGILRGMVGGAVELIYDYIPWNYE